MSPSLYLILRYLWHSSEHVNVLPNLSLRTIMRARLARFRIGVWNMTLTRRNLLEASLSGMALHLAQAEPTAEQWNRNPDVAVIGVDGSFVNDADGNSIPDSAVIDDYQRSRADVWQFS